MTNVKKKIFLPIGVSFLALIAFQASVQAQEATTEAPEASAVEPGLPDAGAVTAMIENAPTAKPREISDAVDPVAKADLERLDREGVVGKQARLGEEILIINRQIRRAEAIKELLGYLGVEGFKKEYPELAEQLKDSPILLEADLNRAKILAEIAAIGTEEEEAKPLAARDDGSSFFSQNGLAMPRDTPIATPPCSLRRESWTRRFLRSLPKRSLKRQQSLPRTPRSTRGQAPPPNPSPSGRSTG